MATQEALLDNNQTYIDASSFPLQAPVQTYFGFDDHRQPLSGIYPNLWMAPPLDQTSFFNQYPSISFENECNSSTVMPSVDWTNNNTFPLEYSSPAIYPEVPIAAPRPQRDYEGKISRISQYVEL